MKANGREIDVLLTNIKRNYNDYSVYSMEEEITDEIDHFVRTHNNVNIKFELTEYIYKNDPRNGLDIFISMTGDSDASER